MRFYFINSSFTSPSYIDLARCKRDAKAYAVKNNAPVLVRDITGNLIKTFYGKG